MPPIKDWYGGWQNTGKGAKDGKTGTNDRRGSEVAVTALLSKLPATAGHEDMTSQDELKLSTPYSNVQLWAKIVLGQLLSGKSHLRGPPGLWELMESRLSSFTAREKTSLYFALATQGERV